MGDCCFAEQFREFRSGVMAPSRSPQKHTSPKDITQREVAEDRRQRPTWSIIYGNFSPRRRDPRRSEDRNRFIADWHHPMLLYSAIAILLLSATDAYLTMRLLSQGARELNWFMAQLIHADTQEFVALKMALTGLGVIVLVTRRHTLLFGRISTESILYVVLVGYVILVIYELNGLYELAGIVGI